MAELKLKTESPVLRISENPDTHPPRRRGRKKSDSAPVFKKFLIPEPPKINPITFPVLISRIMLKSNVPPQAGPRINESDYNQLLCLLCFAKPSAKKRIYHMFTSTDKHLDKDIEKENKEYKNRKDLDFVRTTTVETFCARSLYHKIQRTFTDVLWNKRGNVFETDWIGFGDVWIITNRIYDLHNQEVQKLINYTKFLSVTNS